MVKGAQKVDRDALFASIADDISDLYDLVVDEVTLPFIITVIDRMKKEVDLLRPDTELSLEFYGETPESFETNIPAELILTGSENAEVEVKFLRDGKVFFESENIIAGSDCLIDFTLPLITGQESYSFVVKARAKMDGFKDTEWIEKTFSAIHIQPIPPRFAVSQFSGIKSGDVVTREATTDPNATVNFSVKVKGTEEEYSERQVSDKDGKAMFAFIAPEVEKKTILIISISTVVGNVQSHPHTETIVVVPK